MNRFTLGHWNAHFFNHRFTGSVVHGFVQTIGQIDRLCDKLAAVQECFEVGTDYFLCSHTDRVGVGFTQSSFLRFRQCVTQVESNWFAGQHLRRTPSSKQYVDITNKLTDHFLTGSVTRKLLQLLVNSVNVVVGHLANDAFKSTTIVQWIDWAFQQITAVFGCFQSSIDWRSSSVPNRTSYSASFLRHRVDIGVQVLSVGLVDVLVARCTAPQVVLTELAAQRVDAALLQQCVQLLCSGSSTVHDRVQDRTV